MRWTRAHRLLDTDAHKINLHIRLQMSSFQTWCSPCDVALWNINIIYNQLGTESYGSSFQHGEQSMWGCEESLMILHAALLCQALNRIPQDPPLSSPLRTLLMLCAPIVRKVGADGKYRAGTVCCCPHPLDGNSGAHVQLSHFIYQMLWNSFCFTACFD